MKTQLSNLRREISTPVHFCESANTCSGSVDFDGIDVTVCGFDQKPETFHRVVELLKLISESELTLQLLRHLNAERKAVNSLRHEGEAGYGQ
jgi:hypothetical protein